MNKFLEKISCVILLLSTICILNADSTADYKKLGLDANLPLKWEKIASVPEKGLSGLDIANVGKNKYLLRLQFTKPCKEFGLLRIYLDRDNDPKTGRKGEGMDFLIVAQEKKRAPYAYKYFWKDGKMHSNFIKIKHAKNERELYLLFPASLSAGKQGRISFYTAKNGRIFFPVSFTIPNPKETVPPELKQKSKLDTHNKKKRIEIASKTLTAVFADAANDFALIKLENRNGINFLKTSSPLKSWWMINLQAERGKGRGISVDGSSPCQKSFELKNKADNKILVFKWQGINLGSEKAVLDVICTLEASRNNRFLYWRFQVKNRSRTFGIRQVSYPILPMAPIRNQAEENYFVIPYGHYGYVIKDPFFTSPKRYIPPAARGGRTDGSMKMSFVAYYHSRGDGIYFGLYDKKCNEKHVFQKIDRKACKNTLMFQALPPNLAYPGENYRMPYPIAISGFQGNWFDACQLYREWAAKQFWCGKGPLAQRKDIPKFYLKTPVILRFTHTHSAIPEENIRSNYLKAEKFLGAPLTACYYSWQKFHPYRSVFPKSCSAYWPLSTAHGGSFSKPVAGFKGTVDLVHRNGGYIQAYVNSLIYDQDYDPQDDLEARKHASLNINGKRTVYTPHEPGRDMCRATRWWQKRYADICAWLAKDYDVDGVYLDSFGSNQNRCFDTSHGHTYGGGNFNVMGSRELLKAVRRAVASIKPGFILSIEHNGEAYIDLVDSALMGNHTVTADYAPLFQAVYHDYFMTVQGSCIWYGQIEETPVNFAMEMGNAFTNGAKLGRLNAYFPEFYLANPRYKIQAEYTKLLADYRKNLLEYFTFGQLLRPIVYLPECTMMASDKPGTRNLKLPAVLPGVFKAPDGKIGMVFFNYNSKPETVSFKYNLAEYLSGNKCIIREVDRNGKRKQKTQTLPVQNFKYQVTVQPYSVKFMEIGIRE